MTFTPAVQEHYAPQLKLASWTQSIKRSVLREMLAVVSKPGILSFAGGLPAPEMFPVREFGQAAGKVLSEDAKALQYGPPYPPLKDHIVELMHRRGVECTNDQVFITTGAQQALNVVTRLLLNPAGAVLIEELVYTGIQQALAGYQAEVITVPTDLEHGMDVDEVEDHLLSGVEPAYIYTVPVAHNPLGVSLSDDRAKKLLEVARKYSVPIIEDDPYGFLWYESNPKPALRSHDSDWVIYVGSFSKILAPALRLGWMVIPEYLIPTLTVLKEALDLETSAFIQRTVSAYLDEGYLFPHISKLCEEYRLRRDTMLSALRTHFPSSAQWTYPTGGMFIWVELPAHVDTVDLLGIIVEEEGVAYIPGTAFSSPVNTSGSVTSSLAGNCMRLNFSNSKPEEIEEGIARLGRVLSSHC